VTAVGQADQPATLPAPLQSVLEAAAHRCEIAEIDVRLRFCEDTVKNRLARIHVMFEARNRAHALSIGYRIGVLRSGEWLVLAGVLTDRMAVHAVVLARCRVGMPPDEMARQVGRSPAWLGQLETGNAPWPLRELLTYTEFLGFDLDRTVPHLRVAA
jgi:hypothetical protein